MTRALAHVQRPPRLAAAFASVLAVGALAASATGFGATDASITTSANVVGTLALTDPASLSATPGIKQQLLDAVQAAKNASPKI